MLRVELGAGRLRCHYCPAVATTMDHIVPKAYGAQGCLRNLQPACGRCNKVKGVRLPVCSCAKCCGALEWWLDSHLPVVARSLLMHLTPEEAARLSTVLWAGALAAA